MDASLIELDNVYSYDGRKSSFKHLLKLVQADWWMIALGTVSFCLIGFEISSLYILMSESLEVKTTNMQYFYITFYTCVACL